MDALRRLVRPAGGQSAGSIARRVYPHAPAEETARLRGGERRLANAIEQLRGGVPLNWGQIEDDAELLTLARLQQAAQECRSIPLSEPSAEAKATLIEQLSRKLPVPKPKPEKVVPKTVAGFSERVQVLTQVEDDVRLTTNVPALLARSAIVVVVALLAIWGVSSLVGAFTTPTFRWVELRRDNEVINRVQRPGNWLTLPCQAARQRNPFRPLRFELSSLEETQQRIDFHLPSLPEQVTIPTTFTLQLSFAALDPCQEGELQDNQPGAIVKLAYDTIKTTVDANARPNVFGVLPVRTVVAPLSAFVMNGEPVPLDTGTGSWKEVRIAGESGELHGVYWHGNTYRDRSDVRWIGEVSVLAVEHDDTVIMLVGSYADQITEEMLEETARKVKW